jgi:molybdopterin/thiamine biosynthesis adenylyltransferase/molybdopterin synthase catalytic subunit/rhodanese-related sulfurtransferase
MRAFFFSEQKLDPEAYRGELADAAAGGYATFEGWVRDHNDGRSVRHLEYEAFQSLAEREGERIVAEAIEKFGIKRAACVHRVGDLAIGELAVWVGASSAHRAEAFAACRYIIDAVKHRVPIWKKEHYVDGTSGWVNCERCASAATDGAATPDTSAQEAYAGSAHAVEHQHRHPQEAALAAASFQHDYSRQMALPELGAIGQQKLQAGSVLVVGAGGLGVPVLQYLAAAGVGRIGIVDGDTVEASNLHRQPLYGIADVGQLKGPAAAARLGRLNRDVQFDVHAERADARNLQEWLPRYDLILDCTDNFATKFRINDAAVRLGKPAIFASVYQYEGQLQVYLPRPDWPCLRCLWPEAPRDGLVGNCAQAGVLGPVPAMLGSLQAMQALKILLDMPAEAAPTVHMFDLLEMHWRTLKASRNPACDHELRLDPSLSGEMAAPLVLELDFDSLNAARASGLTLLDIRETWERALDDPEQQIELHVPLSSIAAGDSPALPRDVRYLIVCAHGVRSLALAEHLHEQGYPNVHSLAGGLAGLALKA